MQPRSTLGAPSSSRRPVRKMHLASWLARARTGVCGVPGIGIGRRLRIIATERVGQMRPEGAERGRCESWWRRMGGCQATASVARHLLMIFATEAAGSHAPLHRSRVSHAGVRLGKTCVPKSEDGTRMGICDLAGIHSRNPRHFGCWADGSSNRWDVGRRLIQEKGLRKNESQRSTRSLRSDRVCVQVSAFESGRSRHYLEECLPDSDSLLLKAIVQVIKQAVCHVATVCTLSWSWLVIRICGALDHLYAQSVHATLSLSLSQHRSNLHDGDRRSQIMGQRSSASTYGYENILVLLQLHSPQTVNGERQSSNSICSNSVELLSVSLALQGKEALLTSLHPPLSLLSRCSLRPGNIASHPT